MTDPQTTQPAEPANCDPREFGLTAADLRAAADYLYDATDLRRGHEQWAHDRQVRSGQIRSRLRSLADAIEHADATAVSRDAEVLHAEHHPGTFVPSLDSCPVHERADYEQRIRDMNARSVAGRGATDGGDRYGWDDRDGVE